MLIITKLRSGIDPKTSKPYLNRLYSISSTRYGDDQTGRTVSISVRRQVQRDEQGQEDSSKKGVCSNFLCDSKPDDTVLITGPSGKIMLLPHNQPDADLILIATGTGIAPFRGFLRRLFVEDNPAARSYRGKIYLILGATSAAGQLYKEELDMIRNQHPDRLKVIHAFSREQKNALGGKMYVQDRVAEHGAEIFERMAHGAHIYFCGLRGMMPGILKTLETISQQNNLEWPKVSRGWKDDGRWHVEVY